MTSTFENPFINYNAAKMSISDISSLWCDPLPYLEASGIINEVFLKSPDPIIMVGGRGSGKTMYLRYWSYKVLIERLLEQEHVNILSESSNFGGTSIYLRIEGSTLKEFDGVLLEKQQWNSLFIHFFELSVAVRYIDFLKSIESFTESEIISKILFEIAQIFNVHEDLDTIPKLQKFINTKITELDSYRTNLPFNKELKLNSILYSSNQLIKSIPLIFKNNIKEFSSHIFFITIDEYENFSIEQQRVVNTYIKFADENLSFRISMRPAGFKTYDTVNTEDFIKEGNDYTLLNFDRYNMDHRNKKYKEFLNDMCRKRIKHVNPNLTEDFLQIQNYLMRDENLNNEIANLSVKNKSKKILKQYLRRKISDKDLILLQNSDNLLMEMLNIIWYNRSEEITSAQINDAMNSYLRDGESPLKKKYKLDYADKYRYTLTLLILSALKTKKSFYSFNTFSYISNNNPRFFINLCAETFQEAYFTKGKLFITDLPISESIQSEAAYSNAKNELKEAGKISKFGSQIRRFILNIGNTFKNWQTDPKARYPETNQFSVDLDRLTPASRSAFMECLKWSIIIEKENLQRVTPGSPLNQIYTLNKIFCPLFSISYRTRGGYNMQISPEQMSDLFLENDFIIPVGSIERMKKIENISKKQFKLNFNEEE
ncbi:hypothetical protein ACFO3O_19020 [Dokdonia ponticola]|uniref:ATP-binding protein n=1 Tax=Dokdonia ponticola TaxID=2041041 RepID=A0ABV9I1H9_9FLAO